MKLTEAQVKQFETDGVLIAEKIFTDNDLQPVIDELTEWVDQRAKTLLAEGKITELYEGAAFDERIAHLAAASPEAQTGMDIMYILGERMFRFLHNPNLLEAVACLVGENISCNPIQHVRAKQPDDGRKDYFGNVPWHQDSGVTWEEADASNIVTCWIPLVDACVENGCMKMIPGVKSSGHLEHVSGPGGTTIRPDLLPGTEPIVGECPKGGVIFMDKTTPHVGLPNTRQNHARWTLDLRYQPADTPSGRPFHPSFIVKYPLIPSREMHDVERWRSMWREALANTKSAFGHRVTKK